MLLIFRFSSATNARSYTGISFVRVVRLRLRLLLEKLFTSDSFDMNALPSSL